MGFWPGMARDGRAEGTHRDITPARVVVEALVDVVLQRYRDAVHEGGAWRDSVAIPHHVLLLLRDLHTAHRAAMVV